MKEMLPNTNFASFGVPNDPISSKHCESGGEEDFMAENTRLLDQDNTVHNQKQQVSVLPFVGFDDLCFDHVSAPCQLCQEEHMKLVKIHSEIEGLLTAKQNTSSATSFTMLNKYCGSKSEQYSKSSEKFDTSKNDNAGLPKAADQMLSTTEIIRLACEKFVVLSSTSQLLDDVSEHSQRRDVEVIQQLLFAADRVELGQLEDATMLLDRCDEYSCIVGNPGQRLVYYFSKSLRERIELGTGKIATKGIRDQMKTCDVQELNNIRASSLIALNKYLPISKVMQFTSMQAILENVTDAKKIHMIDLEIRIGAHWPILIQALASRDECPVEYLYLTAVGTESKTSIEEIGMSLKNFAESMNLVFYFSVVMVSDMLDIDKSLFELKSEEVVAVYSPYLLWTMIGQQDRLEGLMEVIRGLNPCVMVVAEIEASLNSPVFVKRFSEALFYYGTFFDCLADCLSNEVTHRNNIESFYFGPAITNILTAEKEDRKVRHVKTNVWRTFFSQVKLVQKELSMSCLYQAMLVSKKCGYESCLSLAMDGKSMIVGWKGTSLLSLSAWKFV